jgi:hypothetical protein
MYDTTTLNLGNNFAIEMNVNKESLTQFPTRYIFDNDSGK